MERQDFSLVRGDPPFRWQQRIGLVPRRGGLGVVRRALFWSALAWLPVAVWAWWDVRALPRPGQTPELLLQHFGVHVRLLLGIPLLIVAEGSLHEAVRRMRPLPIGVVGLLAIVLPVAIPFVGVLAIQIPVKELLLQLARGLL